MEPFDYRVAIMAGEEEIAEQTASHNQTGPQRAIFSIEYFEDLPADAKFEAYVQISTVGASQVSPVQSEEFVLEFGETQAKSSAGSGKIERSSVDGAIAITNRAAFDGAVADGHLPPRATEAEGFISLSVPGGRSVRSLAPVLIRQIEDDWQRRGGAPVGGFESAL